MAKLFYFCHLKKLVRPETFGPYHVAAAAVIAAHIFEEMEEAEQLLPNVT